MSGAEDGHEDAHAAEDERVEGPAEGPPGAQEQEDGEVNERRQRGQHDACRNKKDQRATFNQIINRKTETSSRSVGFNQSCLNPERFP